MEEAFKREKEETDRLLREQKLEYETKIVQLQKQVMETSISQSMLSSILSSSGLIDSTMSIRQEILPENPSEIDPDELSCSSKFLSFPFSIFFLSDCSWTEDEYQLAWWTWKKWRYHRMTSLRVSSLIRWFLFWFFLRDEKFDR